MVAPGGRALCRGIEPGLLDVLGERLEARDGLEPRAQRVVARETAEVIGMPRDARAHRRDPAQTDRKPELAERQARFERAREVVARGEGVDAAMRVGEQRVDEAEQRRLGREIAVRAEVDELGARLEHAADPERVGRGPRGTGREAHRAHEVDLAVELRGLRREAVLRRAHAREGDEPVERVVLAHRRDERAREVDAHLPVHAHGAAGTGLVGERGNGGVRELDGVRVPRGVAGREGELGERVRPAREVVEVLAVAVPLEALVLRLGEWLVERAFAQRLADAKAARGRAKCAGGVVESADPAGARVAWAVAAEDFVDEVGELDGVVEVLLHGGRAVKREERGERVGVGPEVAARGIGRTVKAGADGEGAHQAFGGLDGLAAHGGKAWRAHRTPTTGNGAWHQPGTNHAPTTEPPHDPVTCLALVTDGRKTIVAPAIRAPSEVPCTCTLTQVGVRSVCGWCQVGAWHRRG